MDKTIAIKLKGFGDAEKKLYEKKEAWEKAYFKNHAKILAEHGLTGKSNDDLMGMSMDLYDSVVAEGHKRTTKQMGQPQISVIRPWQKAANRLDIFKRDNGLLKK